jgi:hypothetical protein
MNVDALTARTRALGTSIRNVEEPHLHMGDERRAFLSRCLHVAHETLGKAIQRRRHLVLVSMDRYEFL